MGFMHSLKNVAHQAEKVAKSAGSAVVSVADEAAGAVQDITKFASDCQELSQFANDMLKIIEEGEEIAPVVAPVILATIGSEASSAEG